MYPKERHDKIEDRCWDKKTHDNPHHPSMVSHLKRQAEARQQLEDFLKKKKK